jgi:maleylpyruvate isomerase
MATATIDDVRRAQHKIESVVALLDDADLRVPSRLPGWSIAHVVAHVALNAEAFGRAADQLRAGRLGIMYPGGMAGRTADIEQLASAEHSAIGARLHDTGEHFLDTWQDPAPSGACATAEGFPPFPAETVILRRLREVEVHGLDTGLAQLDASTWSTAFVDADLPIQWETVVRRTDQAITILDELDHSWSVGSGAAPAGPMARHDILAWVLDRGVVPGLPTLVSWGDASRWRP